jgi:hypothetical protein
MHGVPFISLAYLAPVPWAKIFCLDREHIVFWPFFFVILFALHLIVI